MTRTRTGWLGGVAAAAWALTACSPAPDAVQGKDGETLPDATADRLAATQDYSRARNDAVEVDAQLAVEVERLSNEMARAEACGESTSDAGRELATALDGADLGAEDRATMESFSAATIAQATAERRGDAACP